VLSTQRFPYASVNTTYEHTSNSYEHPLSCCRCQTSSLVRLTVVVFVGTVLQVYEYRGTEDERNSFFGISLVDLIDGLSVFATSDGLAELSVKCPESKATLNLE